MAGQTREGKTQAQTQAMNIDALITLVPTLVAIIGVWVNFNAEVAKLKGRVYRLESDQNELKAMLKECVEGIQELKILLAKKGF
tara:strand:- start:171 stop:422 length:252 start_codon:yes stop_codon:yes gene_type:complete